MTENEYLDLKRRARSLTTQMLDETLSTRRIKKLLPPPKEEETVVISEPTEPKTVADEVFGDTLVKELKERYNKSLTRDAKIKEALGDTNVVWKPHAGVQEDFLKSPEYEVLFCGGRASGKSDCLIADTTRFLNNSEFKIKL